MFSIFKSKQNKSHQDVITNHITSTKDMALMASPVLDIPGWNETQVVKVRLKRPSLLDMLEQNQIPNELIGYTYELLKNPLGNPMSEQNATDDSAAKRFREICVAVAKASLVEPTYEEIIQEVGYMTDQQLNAIYIHATVGVSALKMFRERCESLTKIGSNSDQTQD